MRLVFDTHYFRGLREPLLEELRRRGFVLSVSYCAYLEALHRAFENEQPNLFFAPARRFAAFVDPAYPVAALAGDLLTRLGALVPEGRPPRHRAEYITAMQQAWRFATAGTGSDPVFGLLAAGAKQELAERKDTWLRLAENWRARARESMDETERRNLAIMRAADANKLRRAMVRLLREAHPAPRMRPPRADQRFHAYLAVMGRRLLRSGGGAETATGNDAQDLAQLMHIGERAVVVTRDEKLLSDVDASWTFQAPWVRTLVEVLTEPLPLGRPWGRTLRGARRRFLRRPYAELTRAEGEALARLAAA
jgi:hypothetical protein